MSCMQPTPPSISPPPSPSSPADSPIFKNYREIPKLKLEPEVLTRFIRSDEAQDAVRHCSIQLRAVGRKRTKKALRN